jgi:hypothetical protein
MANLNESKKFHFLYKTINLLNKKYYIGVHSTSNFKDGYLGSGKRLKYSIRKYGKENFKLEILEWYNNREELIEREKELVNDVLLSDKMCLNLKPGGSGGFNNEEHKRKFIEAGHKAAWLVGNGAALKRLKELFQNDPKWVENYKANKSKKGGTWLGKKHKNISKKIIGEKNSLHQKGMGNSQFGTMWITNGNENKKIKKEENMPIGWNKGRKL